jgi:hypothetical protein
MPYDPSAVRSGSTFSTNPSYQGAWICYVNGVEVPIVGFDVQAGVWQIPAFTIHMVPDILLQRLGAEDRVPVQIFYLDQWLNPAEPEFRLLVDGEIVGWQYSSSKGQRTMAFSCLAHIHVFQQLYFFYMTNVDDIVAAQSPEAQASGFSQPGLLYPYSLFHQGLLVTNNQVAAASPPPPRRPGSTTAQTSPPTVEDPDAGVQPEAQPIKAPYELVYNVIKGVISTTVPNNRRAVPMMNFFARHIRKTRLHNRFVRLPFLEDPERIGAQKGVFPIFNAARNDEAMNAMQRQAVSQIGSSGPVWNVLQQIYSMVYMELAMIPNPPAVLVALNPQEGEPQDGRILRLLTPDLPVQARPSAGVLAAEADITAMAETFARNIRAAVRGQASIGQDVLAAAGFSRLPATEIEVDVANIRTHLERQARQLGGIQPSAVPPIETTDPTTPIRLAQYFVKPQFLFGVPPHCNVIFPSMVDGWTYDESFIQQPTRIYVNDSVMTQLLRAQGSNRHFMLHALTVAFPEEADALMEHKVGGDDATSETTRATPGMMESGKNLLIWPEEYYKGPVTAKLALPSWFQMLRQFSNGNAGNGSSGGASAPTTTPAPARTTTPNTAAGASPAPPNVPATPQPPIMNVAVPPTVSNARRGQVFDRVQSRPDFAYRWLISAEALAEGNRKTVPYSLPKYRDLTPSGYGTPRGSTERVPRWQQPISPALRILAEHLQSIFGSAIQRFYYHAGGQPVNPRPDRVVDPHIAGRAVDVMIRTVRRGSLYSMPDLEHGNPIAEYLVRNCDVFGIQYFIWARSQWSPSKPIGRKFSHYNTAPESERFDHFNHLHVELSVDAAAGNLPFYRTNGSSAGGGPERPARTVFGPPNTTGLVTTLPPGQNPREITRSVPLPQPGTEPGPTGTRTVARIIPTAQVNATEGQVNSDDSFQNLFRLYAQYEYLKQRYTVRRAAAQLRFNPYLVPGFPAMLFDHMSTRFHMVGYIQSFNHSANASGSGSLGTDVQFTCCRTLPEFINDVRTDAERFASRVTAAPAEIIDEIRVQIQDENQAEAFYRRLLYGDGPRLHNAPTAFRWDQAMGYSRGLAVEAIEIVGESVSASVTRMQAAQQALRDAANPDATPSPSSTNETSNANPVTATNSAAVLGATSQRQQTVTHNLDPNQELSPRENIYQDAFDRYDIAMQLASRPTCSLTQYIRFWHGGMTVNDLMARGEVGQAEDSFAYAETPEQDVVAIGQDPTGDAANIRGATSRKSAVFYAHIFKLRPGPGVGEDRLQGPSEAERGYTDPPSVRPSTVHAGVSATYPQTRADWDLVLEQYREKVRKLLRPSR